MVTSRVTAPWAAVLPLLLLGAFATGCEPEIGSPCDDNEAEVNELVPQNEGTNNLVQDVGFDNCSQGFCLSFAGSRPFCTKECTADLECAEAGADFVCTDVVTFGPLACLDYEDPLAPQPGTDPSAQPCESDADCETADEACFLVGDLAGTCGIPGRDCLTGDGGGKSEAQLRYCAASPDVIDARDVQYGRTPQ